MSLPPWIQGKAKLHGCEEYSKEPGTFEKQEIKELQKAWKPICDNKEYAFLGDTWIEPGYEKNYEAHYGKDGWLDEAYISYMAIKGANSKTEDQILGLARSIHANSEKPLIVVNYGEVAATKLDPAKFPRLIMFHSYSLDKTPRPVNFNFNKFRAIMSTKVRTWVQLDADQYVIGHADRMFKRTREEINADYPYPMLPVHWMSKDDDKAAINQPHPYQVYDFFCPKCAKRTMRWGHAHPTGTFYAYPFLGEAFKDVADHRKLEDGQDLGNLEDEDILNVKLWEKKATKQWCKFDIPWVRDMNLFLEGKGEQNSQDQDPKWYPEGIPKVFYTAHHAYELTETMDSLMKFAMNRTEVMDQKPILFRGVKRDATWYNNGAELKAAHPDLKCII